MSEEAPPKKQESAGAPAWVMTFADLMSLLMCFFVLLLSFSEMDLLKFKQIAGSMEKAFGVQRAIKAKEPPKGTSMIAKEFSPGRPTPTPLQKLRQDTINEKKQTVDFFKEKEKEKAQEKAQEKTKIDLAKLSAVFSSEIEKGVIRIGKKNSRIMIRIRENGSFPSGSSTVKDSFTPVLEKLKEALVSIEGKIAVAGHTDNVPIKTAQFQSNWALSASRAVAVTHALLQGGSLSPERFIIEGYADVQPITTNLTADGRALNRRVEITIIKNESGEELSYQSSDGTSDSAPSSSGGPFDRNEDIGEQATATGMEQQGIIDPDMLSEEVRRLSNNGPDIKE